MIYDSFHFCLLAIDPAYRLITRTKVLHCKDEAHQRILHVTSLGTVEFQRYTRFLWSILTENWLPSKKGSKIFDKEYVGTVLAAWLPYHCLLWESRRDENTWLLFHPKLIYLLRTFSNHPYTILEEGLNRTIDVNAWCIEFLQYESLIERYHSFECHTVKFHFLVSSVRSFNTMITMEWNIWSNWRCLLQNVALLRSTMRWEYFVSLDIFSHEPYSRQIFILRTSLMSWQRTIMFGLKLAIIFRTKFNISKICLFISHKWWYCR